MSTPQTPGGDASLATSAAVTRIFSEILDAVHDGSLEPGDRISDGELAIRFGVSRTPVREALQRLREIGVIEASASRFTRIAVVTPLQTQQAYAVWLALFATLVDETVPRASGETVALMRADHESFLEGLRSGDNHHVARANFDLVRRLQADSANPILLRALGSVVHIVRLGALHLPQRLDLERLAEAQLLLIAAAEGRDLELGREALKVLRAIPVPQD